VKAPVRKPDDRPSKDGPLSCAPKKVRDAEPEPNPAEALGKDVVAALRQAPAPPIQAPEPTEPPWKRSNKRPVFASDVAIAELRKLALFPDRFRGPPPPSTDGKKYLLAVWLAGVAMVTTVGFIGYRLGSAPPPGSPPHALPASQLNQQTLASERSVAYAAEPAEQALGGLLIPAKSEPRRYNASEIAAMMRSGAQLMANGDVSGARLMYLRLAEEGEALAALALAETYDPPVLRKSKIRGAITPNVALARSWYEKAKALGSPVAAERLERLARLASE
jgi:hypothetical protein